MTRPNVAVEGKARVAALTGVVVLQALCAAFFLADVLGDLHLESETGTGFGHHLVLEAVTVGALILGTVFGAREVRNLLARQARMEQALRAAGGAFAELLDEHFTRWGLTPAERDVALMAIKGLSNTEIAAARGAAEGTVKAQSAAIYAKAGVAGRTQLLSVFIEELLAEPLQPAPSPRPAARAAGAEARSPAR